LIKVRPTKNENNKLCCFKIFISVKLEMYPLEFREAVIQLYNYFNSMRRTALVLKVSIATISRWTKTLEPKKYVRKNIKTSDALKSFILLKISSRMRFLNILCMRF
jgi:DNA-binding MarR family transcriptional regulator